MSAQTGMPSAAPVTADSSSTQVSLPEAPAPVVKLKIADWKYDTITGSLFAASIADAETLERCDNCTVVPASLRRRGVTYGVGLPVDVAVSYLGYELKMKSHRWWYVPAIALTAANAYLSYRYKVSSN
jgi:hypothetical protein